MNNIQITALGSVKTDDMNVDRPETEEDQVEYNSTFNV